MEFAAKCKKCGKDMGEEEWEKTGAMVTVEIDMENYSVYTLCSECCKKLQDWMAER